GSTSRCPPARPPSSSRSTTVTSTRWPATGTTPTGTSASLSPAGTPVSAEPDAHPSWCVRHFCTANQRRTGAHRSQPIVANEAPLRFTAGLYAEAGLPDDVLVELTRNGLSLVLLPATVAHNLGRVLKSLGTAAEGIEPS